ncbi:MAG: hypothetical protein HOQ24_07370 [Mycobacteriaceae bacterium]|nr:hypothetical protein [Mycobacteriaceae bacterium]
MVLVERSLYCGGSSQRRFSVATAATFGVAAPAAADEALPVGFLPGPLSCLYLALPGRAGAWPVPLHYPTTGIGEWTLLPAPPGVAARLPNRVSLRTDTAGFNDAWQYALLDGHLYVKATQRESGWRVAPVPQCIQGQISAISVDGGRLAATTPDGRLYTLDLADQTPELWWWTSRFGSPIWLNPTGSRVRPGYRWNLSWLDPDYREVLPFRQYGSWTDRAGHHNPVGGAGVTTVYALSPGGNHIHILDPWLPASDLLHFWDPGWADDYSYEMPGPLGGRFRAVNLSSAGSTTFVINRHGDMYTRLWDFDISGADTTFFTYSHDDQTGRREPPNNFAAWVLQYLSHQQYAYVQLPPPAWLHQPKVPGAITSAISIHQTGRQSPDRELRVEGRASGRNGFWHKPIDPRARWAFTPTDEPLRAPLLDNPARDTSATTLAPLSGIGYDYRDPAGWTLSARDFDYASDTMALRLCSARRVCATVHGELAPTLRVGRQPDGLSEIPRDYQGILSISPAERAAVARSAPSLRPVLDRLAGTGRHVKMTMSATATALTIHTDAGGDFRLGRPAGAPVAPVPPARFTALDALGAAAADALRRLAALVPRP